ncbi:AIR synthase [Pseudoflavitalea sp. G-6-1-2]|uniref:AIR synthase-related protein n=1 Tax=Pseudoflavitalea sp. G-6-1-2 TaxID=2728841 RepID=UPI00146E729F|nr:AIR synthase-related protein [Pseudoflavitalea sp. G-6-1-2]NML20058.1 AIR synthase [Pseudoflavitalea sp. G-6-1-2]
MSNFADSGKLHMDLFNQLIYPYAGADNKQLLAGPEYGVDVSLISLPGGLSMALTSDPLSWIPSLGLQESAWLSVHLMANDMATTSQAPQFVQLVLNLPETCTAADFEQYWMHIHRYCKAIGVAISGGHTGKAAGLNSTIAGGGTMVCTGPSENFLLSKYAEPGDLIIVTKEAAQIAASVLALSFPETVKKHCGQDVWQTASELFWQTSSLREGLCAASLNKHSLPVVTAMHDVTEGGILGAIYEMASAAGCGAYIQQAALPVGEAQKLVCSFFEIDPLCCVGAGSMIMAVKPQSEALVLSELQQLGIKATTVGRFTGRGESILLESENELQQLNRPGPDPYWNAFFQSFKNGWK